MTGLERQWILRTITKLNSAFQYITLWCQDGIRNKFPKKKLLETASEYITQCIQAREEVSTICSRGNQTLWNSSISEKTPTRGNNFQGIQCGKLALSAAAAHHTKGKIRIPLQGPLSSPSRRRWLQYRTSSPGISSTDSQMTLAL